MLCCSCWNCQPWVASKFLKTKWNAQICSSASQAIFKGPRSSCGWWLPHWMGLVGNLLSTQAILFQIRWSHPGDSACRGY